MACISFMQRRFVLKNQFVNKIGRLTFKRAALALTASIAAACSGKPAPATIGTAAPVYSAAGLPGKDSVRLASLRGSVVLLNVWATWCIPCRREIPELEALHQQYSARGLRVVGVSVDDEGADSDVADFMQNFGMRYTVARDASDRVSEIFAIPGVPASFLIDRTGVIRWRHLGPFKSSDADFLKALQKLL
jgi:cytochrome c biogenesis protein CcmG/thiol:disulfide interchange protein DsbE